MKKIVFFSLLLLLSSCSPVYKTQYTFVPPKAQSGKTCIFQCENSKLQCKQLAQSRFNNCQSQSQLQYQSCENNKVFEYNNRKGKYECKHNCYCARPSCTYNDEDCGNQFRSCYQSCGGKVFGKTTCVSNCEEVGGVGAPPPGQANL